MTTSSAKNVLARIAADYDVQADPHYRTLSRAKNPQDYIQIQPWKSLRLRTHYEFKLEGDEVRAELHVESPKASALRDVLAAWEGLPMVEGKAQLRFDPTWYPAENGCRLYVDFAPRTNRSDLIQRAMKELIATTSTVVSRVLLSIRA